MKKILSVLFAVIVVVNLPAEFLLGQNNKQLSPYEKNMQSYSPQVAAQIRYDKINNPLNSGLVNLNIPLISYEDNDFEFPISLIYDSQGFKPNDSGNFVGLNWILSCGGIIHREIMGIPDDLHHDVNVHNSEVVKGFLNIYDLSKNPFFKSPMNKEDILNSPSKYLETLPWNNITVIKNSGNIEASSDIYHFSFGKHSGKFVIGYDGSVNVVSNNGGKYKVDLSNFHFSFSVLEGGITTWHEAPKISITTDDGYIYTFGGTYASLEYMALSWMWAKDISLDYQRIHRINAFHLTEIIAPNGRKLNISYLDPIDDVTYHEYPNKLMDNGEEVKRKKINQTYILNVSPIQVKSSFKGENNEFYNENLITNIRHSLNKISLIKTISTDVGTVRFHYSDREKSLFNPDKDTPFGASCGAKLDSITLAFDNKPKKSIKLNYQYPSGRMMLGSIYDSQIGFYQLKYNDCPSVEPYTIDIDHWGYWSGAGSNKCLLPDLDFSQLESWYEGPFTKYRTSNREPTGRNYNAFLLNEIVYPTNGYTLYKYEPHDYEQYLDQTGYGYVLSLKGSISGDQKGTLAGGARLKSLEHHDGHSTIQHLNYQYTAGINTHRSSGVLLKRKPLYIYGMIPAKDNDTICYIYFNSEGFQTPADYNSEYIKYTNIIEGQSFLNDSSETIIITPLNDVRKKYGEISFGNYGKQEIQNYKWKIVGNGTVENPSIVKLNIHGSKKSEIREYRFDSDIISGTKENISFNPIDEFGEGTIEFYMDASKNNFLSLEISFSIMKKSERGYKEYVFTDFSSNPDYEYRTILPYKEIINPFSLPFLSCYGKKVLDYSKERGLLSKIYSYNSNKEIVQTIEYKYQRQNENNYEISMFAHSPYHFPVGDESHSLRLGQFANIHQVFKIPLYTYLQTELITTNYIDNIITKNPIVNQEIYKYNVDGYLKTKEIKLLGPLGNNYKSINYKYAFEEMKEPYGLMKKMNILSPITQTSTYFGSPSNLISVQKSHYALVGNLLKLQSGILEDRLPIVKEIEYGKNDTSLVKRIEHLKFDLFGNPIHIVKDGMIHLIYLWSYNGQYPIASIEGATYEEVMMALGNTPPEKLSLESQPDPAVLKYLYEKLPHACINTFTYKPSLGLVSTTNDRGLTTYYDYDKRNRLIEVYIKTVDGKKEIIKHYKYSFK